MSESKRQKLDRPEPGACDMEFKVSLKTAAIKKKSLADVQKLLLEKLSLQLPSEVSTLKYLTLFVLQQYTRVVPKVLQVKVLQGR